MTRFPKERCNLLDLEWFTPYRTTNRTMSMTERIFSLMQRMVLTNNHTLYVRSVIRLKNVHNKYPCLPLQHITSTCSKPHANKQHKWRLTMDHSDESITTDNYWSRIMKCAHITGAAGDLSRLWLRPLWPKLEMHYNFQLNTTVSYVNVVYTATCYGWL